MPRHLAFSVTIHDCEVQHFRSGGKGGQNQNKRDTGTRVIHHPSGARGEARDERSQLQNKRKAFRRMAETPTFHAWLMRELGREDYLRGLIADTEALLGPGNLLVETRRNGVWTRA